MHLNMDIHKRGEGPFIFATKEKEMVEKLYSDKTDIGIITKGGFFAPEFPCKQNPNVKSESICLWSDLVRMTEKFEFNFQNAGFMTDGRIFTAKITPTFSWTRVRKRHPKKRLGKEGR